MAEVGGRSMEATSASCPRNVAVCTELLSEQDSSRYIYVGKDLLEFKVASAKMELETGKKVNN